MVIKKNNFKSPKDLSSTIHLLGDFLGQVIKELESQEVFDTEEQIRFASKSRRSGKQSAGDKLFYLVSSLESQTSRAVASAFALYLDLVNLAEDNDRVRSMLNEEQSCYPEPIKGSISEAVSLLKKNGITKEEMAAFLNNMSIELVFTAHPTEAKRRTILSKLQRIAEILTNLQSNDLQPKQAEKYLKDLHAEITAYWLTDRARTNRPAVTDEVRTGLYFIDEILWTLLPEIYNDFDQSLDKYFPGLSSSPNWLQFASWIGGDRDGNPNVTTEVTAETLRLHRGLAVEKYRTDVRDLSRRLSLSIHRIHKAPGLEEWINQRRPLPAHVAYIEERYKNEPYRLVLSLLNADLRKASQDDMFNQLVSNHSHAPYLRIEEMINLLNTIIKALPAPLAEAQPKKILHQMQIFGLHTVHLHLREEASRLNFALAEILRGLGIELKFDKMNYSEKLELLSNLLDKSSPELSNHPGVTQATSETLSLFQLISKVRLIYGQEMIGPFIISMTSSAADILTVLLLSKWTGCEDCLSIVPLFETLSYLEAAPAILSEMFTNKVYRKHLSNNNYYQTVMIGYSDTNKDGGYLAANWALYKAQEEISKVCKEHGVKLTIFHGRGGSTARGGGPANQAIRSQPSDSINGRFHLTEQGEVISSRYSNKHLARYHIEEIVNAVLLSSFTLTASNKSISNEWRIAMSEMALKAKTAYQSLVFNTPGFYKFWQTATPIDEIKRLRMGSRPILRKETEDSIINIRAIPWVFSWMQSRFNLPGWFGLGSGLKTGLSLSLLKEMYSGWSFFSTLINNTEMSMLIADMEIAKNYSNLVPDKNLAKKIFSEINNEYKRTEETILAITGNSNLLDSDPNLQRSIKLRNPYIDPLNFLQVEMLQRLRALSDPDGTEAKALREVVIITINGIAAGLRNTG